MTRDTLLLVTTSYPQVGDGSEAAGGFVADLAEALAEQVPVRVVAPGSKAGNEARLGAVAVSRFASPGRPLSLLSAARPSDWPAIVGTLRSLRAQTLAAGEDGRVAHTLALWALPSGWAAAALERHRGVPYSVWVLGSDIWSLGRIPLVRSVLRQVIRGATHRFSDGLQLAADAAAIGGMSFEFLPSTRKLESRFPRRLATAPPFKLLFLGRWHPNKGIDLLLDALNMLDESSWSRIGEVHIAGGGPMGALVHSEVGELQALGRPLRLSGYLNRDEANAALAQADYLLLPSRIESIPLIFSDAMKAGCPVIATPVGDLPALYAREHFGFLSEGVGSRYFSAAIGAALHASPSLYTEQIRRHASAFDLRTIATHCSQLLSGRTSSVQKVDCDHA